MKNTADVTGGKPIAVLLQSISGVSAINPLVAFYDIHGGRERCYTFILSRTPHETINQYLKQAFKALYQGYMFHINIHNFINMNLSFLK
jgi:hypothetical protein